MGAPSAVLFILYRALGQVTGLLTSAGVLFAVDFNHTITLGSILTAFIVIAIAGVFTVRSKIATIWRQEAEGERAAKQRLEEALAAERADRLAFERQQQEIRHDLKGENVALRAQLKAVEAKTDLTVALEAIRVMNAELAEHVSGAIMQAWHMRAWLQSGKQGPRPSRAPKTLPAWFHWWRLWSLARIKGKGSWAWKTYLAHIHRQQNAQARLNAARHAITGWARWGAAKTAEIHYTQGQSRDDYLHEPRGRLPLWTDCSGFVTYCYWATGSVPDPSGLDYNYVGFTGTLLENAAKHGTITFDLSQANPGDPIVIGPGSGWHAVIVIEAGPDPLVVSHGSEDGPRIERMSVDPRTPKRVCQTLL